MGEITLERPFDSYIVRDKFVAAKWGGSHIGLFAEKDRVHEEKCIYIYRYIYMHVNMYIYIYREREIEREEEREGRIHWPAR